MNYKNEGYVWLSDATAPIVLRDDSFKVNDNGLTIELGEYVLSVSDKCILSKDGEPIRIPFVIEALFVYNNDSYQIKMIDGEYIVGCFDLSRLNAEAEYLAFYPNRFPEEIQTVCFYRVWAAENDPLCEGMEVLVPKQDVFIGFNKVINNK